MAERGGASMARIIKSSQEEEKEDRISSLPDSLIHHILSFLPATDLVNTSLLSKWWKSLKFVQNPDKFFSFAVRKHVKELNLNMCSWGCFSLPKFLFDNSSLVKLKLSGFSFRPFGDVNLRSLKSLRLENCNVDWALIANALSGSPLLEYLELLHCVMSAQELVIASKRLKTLILADDNLDYRIRGIEISCPNLERLRVSGGLCLTSLELTNLPSSVHATLDFYLEMQYMKEKVMSRDDCINMVQQILRQVEHVQKLELGRRFIKWRSHLLKADDLSKT